MSFDVCSYPNINPKLFMPVITGFWKQHELWDGTYTFNDWLDVVEIIEVKNENEYRINEEMRNKTNEGRR